MKNLISAKQSANIGGHRWLFRHPTAKELRLFKIGIQIFEDKAQINNLPQRPCEQTEDRCDLLTLGLVAAIFF